MKKLILAMTLFCALLLPCFSQKEKEAYRYLKNKISEETEMEESMEELIKIFEDHILRDDKDHIVDIKLMRNIYLFKECYIIVITEKESISFYLGFIQNKKVKFYKLFGASYLNFRENEMFPYSNSILSFQIDRFRYNQTSAFFYDFNHDGNDEMLSFFPSGRANLYTICSFDFVKKN